jgi:hypothetical protein
MVADAMARAVPGLGRRRERWRVRLASLFAVAGVAAALVSFALSSGLRLGLAPRRPSEPPAGNSRLATVPASRDPGTAEGDPVAPTRAEVLAHLAGHLVAETVPPGARVWVDGVAVGTTFADIEVGPGRHRVVLTLPGHRTLAPVPPSLRGTGFVRVECQTQGKFPILIDDEETGFVCPSLRVPAAVGKHTVGIYLPATGRVVSVETTVEPGARPATARFSE